MKSVDRARFRTILLWGSVALGFLGVVLVFTLFFAKYGSTPDTVKSFNVSDLRKEEFFFEPSEVKKYLSDFDTKLIAETQVSGVITGEPISEDDTVNIAVSFPAANGEKVNAEVNLGRNGRPIGVMSAKGGVIGGEVTWEIKPLSEVAKVLKIGDPIQIFIYTVFLSENKIYEREPG